MTRPGENDKAIVLYVTDEGTSLSILQKASMAAAVNNLVLPMHQQQGIPERWRLRHIFIGTVSGGRYYRRKVVIGNPQNPLFTGQFSFVVIDGIQWVIIERKGESRRGPYLTH